MSQLYSGLLRIIRLCLDILSELVFSLLHSVHHPLPPLSTPLLTQSATDIALQIREKHVSCLHYVSAVIQRIREVDPILSCVVDQRFDEALREAAELDRLLGSLNSHEIRTLTRAKPFLGVPFSAKDCIAARGLKQTSGLYLRRNFIAEEDAPVLARMREAGGILVCVTNVSELATWMESYNNVTGITSNPYHTGRTAGGSSGGEGSLIGAGAIPLGIGSDIGGSIRMPALFNGIFGHKPTAGVVSNDGQHPCEMGKMDYFKVTGPMCRNASDLSPMLKVLAGDNGALLGLNIPVNIRKLTFFYMEDDGGNPWISSVHPDMKAAMKNFIKIFKQEFNVKIEKVNIREFFYSFDIWMNSVFSEKPPICADLAGGRGEIQPCLELIKWLFNLSNHTLPALCWAFTEKFGNPSSKENAAYVEMGELLKIKLNSLLGETGVLIYPSHPTPAPYHSQSLLKPFNFAYTAIFNILGSPVTQIPLGLGARGLPLGVQVVAANLMDRLPIAIATEAQRMLGGWVPPSQIL